VSRWRIAAALAVAVGGCALHPGDDQARPSWRWRRTRAEYIAASQVWLGGDVAAWRAARRSRDVLAGPPGDDRPAREALVRCDYLPPERDTFAGRTPKFLCRPGRAKPVKIKWGADNGEIYAEVAGTRLLWALGFPADAVYPVEVECTGCAADPWRDRRPHPGHRPPPFTPATLERERPGTTIAERRHQGWAWTELAAVDPARGGALPAHTDALRLLAAFIQHRDSKPDNQRLFCPPAARRRDADGRLDCDAPVMMIADLGSTFGGPRRLGLNTVRMDVTVWRTQPVWRDAARCIANVRGERDARDGLRDPAIGEAGRQLLGALLRDLTDADVRAVFVAARAERRGGVDAWVAAFDEKRAAVLAPVPGEAAFRCPR
jgi:hypothetical protein